MHSRVGSESFAPPRTWTHVCGFAVRRVIHHTTKVIRNSPQRKRRKRKCLHSFSMTHHTTTIKTNKRATGVLITKVLGWRPQVSWDIQVTNLGHKWHPARVMMVIVMVTVVVAVMVQRPARWWRGRGWSLEEKAVTNNDSVTAAVEEVTCSAGQHVSICTNVL